MAEYPITPIDGRYYEKVAALGDIVSEFALMRNRVQVMAEWVIFLERQGVTSYDVDVERLLRKVVENFSERDYRRIKELEQTSDHDVKATEYWLREQLPKSVWPWLHFACTSEDVNNVAYALMLREARSECDEALDVVVSDLVEKAFSWRVVAMLSHTHGQPATPTTAGKEMAVFVQRIQKVRDRVNAVPLSAKWNGATGDFAAHSIAFPKIDWITLSRTFIERFGFTWNPLTTQIESHDMQAALCNEIGLVCSVLIDLCSDVWGYVSIEYFGQLVVSSETGSSTMPGKVNPISFENARGNFDSTRAIARLIAEKLPVSTWQRDLSDSTMQRNFGTMFGHYLLALKNLKKGLARIVLREDRLKRALQKNPGVLGEAIQTMLRKHGDPDAYERMKEFQRGKALKLQDFRKLIEGLDIPEDDKQRLLSLRPADYVGLSSELVDFMSV